MRGCREIDALASQHVHFLDGIAEAFEMRQMGMEIECRDALEEPQPIERALVREGPDGVRRVELRDALVPLQGRAESLDVLARIQPVR